MVVLKFCGASFLLLLSLSMFLVAVNNDNKGQNKSHASKQPFEAALDNSEVSKVSWFEIDKIYNIAYETTDLQKTETWKNYKGKKVKWSGQVIEVSETFGVLQLQIKMNSGSLMADVVLYLNKDQREKALSLSTNDNVTYIGVLDDWGTMIPMTLVKGEIL